VEDRYFSNRSFLVSAYVSVSSRMKYVPDGI
jgi:hypothetical protein